MKNLYVIFLHRTFHDAVTTDLPEVIIRTHSAQTFFPPACPFRPVIIQPMNIFVCGMLGNPGLDGVPVAFAGQYPQVKVFRHLQHPVPAHTYLAAQIGLTGIG